MGQSKTRSWFLGLTDLVEHLVALIENKLLDAAESKMLVSNKRIETSWCGDNDVWVGLLLVQNIDVILDWSTTVEDRSLDVWEVFAESCILVLDLEGQLTCVAHDEDRGFTGDRLDLLEGCQHKDCSLTKTRLCLTKNIRTENGLRNADLLDCNVSDCVIRFLCRRNDAKSKRSPISFSRSYPKLLVLVRLVTVGIRLDRNTVVQRHNQRPFMGRYFLDGRTLDARIANILRLTLRWMFETAVGNSLKKLWLQKKVAE